MGGSAGRREEDGARAFIDRFPACDVARRPDEPCVMVVRPAQNATWRYKARRRRDPGPTASPHFLVLPPLNLGELGGFVYFFDERLFNPDLHGAVFPEATHGERFDF